MFKLRRLDRSNGFLKSLTTYIIDDIREYWINKLFVFFAKKEKVRCHIRFIGLHSVYNGEAILKTAKERMTCRTNFTSKNPPNIDLCKTPNYTSLFPQNPLQAVAHPQPMFVNTFRQNFEINPLDLDQTLATPNEVSSNAITTAKELKAGLSGQKTSQIDFYAAQPSEQQVVEANQRVRAAADLMTRRSPPKHNNPPAQPMLAFEHSLADLETKLIQQYRLLHATLKKIMKGDQIATPKFNQCTIITIYDTICKLNMMRALIDTTQQGNLLKTQPSHTEGAHPASVDTLLTRIIGFTGELDKELKKLTALQVIYLNMSKLEIMPPEWAQDLVRKPTPETQLTAFLLLLSQLQQQNLNPYAPPNPYCNQLRQQQMQGQQPLQYTFQYSGQPMKYPIYPIQFLVILPPNPFLPTLKPPQTQMNESRLPSSENVRDLQNSIQSSQQVEQPVIQTVERSRQNATIIRSINNLLILPIPAYSQQQTSRILLLPYTIERNQQQKQSQRQISPIHKRADESKDDEFLGEIIPGIIMPHLPPHKTDIETVQRTWQNREYDLLKDPNVIKYKNSKWYSKLTTQKLFTFRDWRKLWSFVNISLEQINIPHYLPNEFESQSIHDKSR
ncbi:MAG: hypothetical protein EZS28_008973 [Streblomastix strix]|uniref:Uncharacterized protein n=1 Tax=Streblomastix strix TaxID=222440 RepID=A0A5J4WMM7_9EUKA|nr:MAG: hypothetical protein EZS28_008973 [Streblomastix strix]